MHWEEPDPDDQETVVTMTLRDAGDETEMTVDQGLFVAEARHDLHHAGWTDSLGRLEEARLAARR